jgi:hypothetical protein
MSTFARMRCVALAVVMTGTVTLAPLGVAGASTRVLAAPNPFCQAMIATHPQPPTGTAYLTYHSFARKYLSYYRKLAAEAPNAAVKHELTQLIAIMTYESATTSRSKLAAYVNANQVTWASDWTLFARAIVACGKWIVNLL